MTTSQAASGVTEWHTRPLALHSDMLGELLNMDIGGKSRKRDGKPRVITAKRKEQNRIHQAHHRRRKKDKQPHLQLSNHRSDTVTTKKLPNAPQSHDLFDETTISADIFSAPNPGVVDAHLPPLMLMNSAFLGPSGESGALGYSTTSHEWANVSLSHSPLDEVISSKFQITATPIPNVVEPYSTINQESGLVFYEDIDPTFVLSHRQLILKLFQASLDTLLQQKSFRNHNPPDVTTAYWADDLGGNDQDVFENCLLNYAQENQATMSASYGVNLYTNNIKLDVLNLLAACFANSAMLGVKRELEVSDYNSDRAHKRGRIVSPFWKARQRLGSVTAVMSYYHYLSHDLQPSVEQVENKHGLYIDFLPFPDFRKRLIAVRSITPPLFNEDDLCDDIDRGGLVCWGSKGSGTPWDMRSWEAKPWFLKKWWMLTGDETGEMFLQSKWYWDLQG